jgi:hypothetical protein
VKSQCFNLLSERLDSLQKIPYAYVDKKVWGVESGQNFSIKIADVKYKSKLAFLFQVFGVGDTLEVTLKTLNQKVLSKKKLTNKDCILRYDPFKKSENYFIIVKIQPNKEKLKGCIGLVIMQRVTTKSFQKVQKINWKVE